MHFVELTPSLRESIVRIPGVLPVQHPVWLDILGALGEEAQGIVAIDDSGVRGWLMYTVSRALDVTVINSLPYIAYGGPHAPQTGVAAALLRRLREVAYGLDADVLSVGTSPLLTADEERSWIEAIAPTHVFENKVQLQSLDRHPLEQLSKKRRDAIESEIRRAERSGLVAIDHLTATQLEEWLDIYRARYAEIGARPYPDVFHRQLHTRAIPAGIAEIRGVVDPHTGKLLGGIAFLVSQREATYFSSAFLSTARRLYPTTFLLNDAFRSFRARGIQMFNWHSSPAQGGVRAYKQRWGAYEHRHYYLSAILKSESRVFALSADEIRLAFPLRFVLPFSPSPTRTIAPE